MTKRGLTSANALAQTEGKVLAIALDPTVSLFEAGEQSLGTEGGEALMAWIPAPLRTALSSSASLVGALRLGAAIRDWAATTGISIILVNEGASGHKLRNIKPGQPPPDPASINRAHNPMHAASLLLFALAQAGCLGGNVTVPMIPVVSEAEVGASAVEGPTPDHLVIPMSGDSDELTLGLFRGHHSYELPQATQLTWAYLERQEDKRI